MTARMKALLFSRETVHAGELSIVLQLFREPSNARLQRIYSAEPGKVVLALTRADSALSLGFPGDTSGLGLDRISFSPGRDTAVIWYRNIVRDSLSVVVERNKKRYDHTSSAESR
jgi:hypothetical protein